MQKGNFIPNLSGIYSLVLFLQCKTVLSIGALGSQIFPKGYYVYTGSAFNTGGLKARIKHHINKNNPNTRSFWHIDFFLTHQNSKVIGVVAMQTDKKMECKINSYIKDEKEARVLVPGFGSSDCKKNCKSHLLFFSDTVKDQVLVQKVAEVYTSLFKATIEVADRMMDLLVNELASLRVRIYTM